MITGLEKFQGIREQASEKLLLAEAYLSDGAMMGAARAYREAADLLEKASAARDEAMKDMG